MKTSKIQLIGIALSILAVACTKNDLVSEKNTSANTSGESQKTQPAVAASQWSAPVAASQQNNKATGYAGSVSDPNITPDIIQNGLVLVFMKDANAVVHSLPFSETNGGIKTNWYYQVSEGGIQVMSNGDVEQDVSLKYYVISNNGMSGLVKSGHSKEDIMSMSYAAAENVFGK
jgi:hypothetical protein